MTADAPQPALDAAEERLAALRKLADADPVGHAGELAEALCALGRRCAALGDHRRAASVTAKGVAVYRELAGEDPPTYAPSLAAELGRLSDLLALAGDRTPARVAAGEAVQALRSLGADGLADLPDALDRLGARLAALGQHSMSATATAEATAIRRTR